MYHQNGWNTTFYWNRATYFDGVFKLFCRKYQGTSGSGEFRQKTKKTLPQSYLINPLSANPTKWSNTLKQFYRIGA